MTISAVSRHVKKGCYDVPSGHLESLGHLKHTCSHDQYQLMGGDRHPPDGLNLGQRAFLRLLQELVEQRGDLVAGARVATKKNATGDTVIAVIIPAVRVDPRH
jgi:hypothetical protein